MNEQQLTPGAWVWWRIERWGVFHPAPGRVVRANARTITVDAYLPDGNVTPALRASNAPCASL